MLFRSDSTVSLYLYAGRAGTAEVTITNDQTADRVTIYVTVRKQNIDFSVEPRSLDLKTGKTEKVWVTFTAPYGYLYWESDSDVVSCRWGEHVSGRGVYLYVTGNRQGKGTIRISNDYNGGWYNIPVNVVYEAGAYARAGKRDGKQKNRALMIGEVSFSPACPRNRNDMAMLNWMLDNVRGQTGGKWTTKGYVDVGNEGLKRLIYDTFKQADEDDVSLFFIATHGNSAAQGAVAGRLALIPEGQESMQMAF